MKSNAYWTKFDFAAFLKPYFYGFDKQSESDIYLIENSLNFSKQYPDVTKELVRQAELVQNSIWNKRFSTFHNTFDVGNLLLFVHQDRVAGFISASKFSCTPTTHCIYLSDAMFLPQIRGKKLSSLGFAILQLVLMSSEPSSDKFLTLVVSGNMAIFKFFLNLETYQIMNQNELSDDVSNFISGFIRHEFPTQKIDECGVIRGAWLPQNKPEVSCWAPAIVTQYGFPENVFYENGDSLIKIFRTQTRSSLIEVSNLVDSRIRGEA